MITALARVVELDCIQSAASWWDKARQRQSTKVSKTVPNLFWPTCPHWSAGNNICTPMARKPFAGRFPQVTIFQPCGDKRGRPPRAQAGKNFHSITSELRCSFREFHPGHEFKRALGFQREQGYQRPADVFPLSLGGRGTGGDIHSPSGRIPNSRFRKPPQGGHNRLLAQIPNSGNCHRPVTIRCGAKDRRRAKGWNSEVLRHHMSADRRTPPRPGRGRPPLQGNVQGPRSLFLDLRCNSGPELIPWGP